MSNQLSFRKFEHEILPNFRNRLNNAESSEDVKKFFNYSAQELFQKIFSSLNLDFEDVALTPELTPPYYLSDKIKNNSQISSMLQNSDLKQILEKLANTALKKYKHLERSNS